MLRPATLSLLLSLLAFSCDKSPSPGRDAGGALGSGPPSAAALAGRAHFEQSCISCHTIGEGDRTGPDLKDVGKRRARDWLVRWIKNPAQMGESDHLGRALSKKYGDVIMPTIDLTDAQIQEVLDFLEDASVRGYKVVERPAKQLAGAELEQAQSIYFDRCAGCHGSLRQGASAPALTAERAKTLGTAALAATLNHGRAAGMPAWGELGILSTADVELLANYLQLPPTKRPELSLDAVRETWNLVTEVAARPKSPLHTRNASNFFAVVLKNQGYVAILDGETRERLVQLDVGFAVELVRVSASARYLYVMGKDGKITLVDLFTSPPSIAAHARGCFDARTLESSKARPDKLLIQGCYWPPQYVVFDGVTLEPLHVEPLTGEAGAAEARVGTIASPRSKPLWALGLMDSGEVALVDYGTPGYAISKRIPAEREVIGGGLDPSGRFFSLPAPARDSLVVVDLDKRASIATIATGKGPRPDPGARWEDPEHGWVAAIPHLSDDKLLVYGIDPRKQASAWKVVREIRGVPAGSLHVRTHPKSPWVWLDSPANPKPELTRQICVISKQEAKVHKCWSPRATGRVMHFEYNQAGTEVWVSGWDKRGALLVYDDASLKELQRVEADWLVNPMNKYNVSNTAEDRY